MPDITSSQLEAIVAEGSMVELRVDHYFVSYAQFWLPRDYDGPRLVATAGGRRLSSLFPGGSDARALPLDLARAMLESVPLARDEDTSQGVDTADGRPITHLRLILTHARGAEHSVITHASINHYAPRALPHHWSRVFRAMRDALGPVGGPVADAWDYAMRWTGPSEMPRAWLAGMAVKVPHAVTAVECDGPLHIRAGQPPANSTLYRLSATSGSPAHLVDVDRNAEIERQGDSWGDWLLPCGGGKVMTHHEWDSPRRVVLRMDDPARPLYVQREQADRRTGGQTDSPAQANQSLRNS